MDLVVPELGDYATIREVTPSGQLRRLAAGHRDPGQATLVRALEAYQSSDAPAILLEVVQTGESRLIPEVPREAIVRAARDPEHLRLLDQLDLHSVMVVPIPARGRVVAVLSLITAGSSSLLSPDELRLVEDVAQRAGLALDNAGLYEAERQSRAEAEAARADAENARSSLSLLLEASMALTSSLHSSEGLANLARLVVAHLADLCIIDILDARGTPKRVAAESGDPAMHPLAATLLRFAPKPGSSHPAVRVMKTGRPEHSWQTPDTFLHQIATEPEHLLIAQSLEFRSYLCVPLAARGRVLGAMTLVATSYSNRQYSEVELRLVEDLARRAGQMLDNARLFEEQAHIAHILQQSLLPAELPQIPGIELAARFRPLIGDIGGDFYDAFPLGQGRWLLAVGDVCGKGPEAAWLTSMIRYTLRAAATEERDPSAMLSVLNAAVIRQAPRFQFCSLACGVLELREAGATLNLALAGHPHPLCRRPDGTVVPVGIPGDLLGVVEAPQFHDQMVGLAPGDAIAFMTDGALDQANVEVDNRALVSVLEVPGDRDAEALAGALESSVLAENVPRYADDILLLVVRARTG